MDDNKQLAQRIDGAIQSASQEVTNLRSELSATSRRLAELGATDSASMLETLQHNHNGKRAARRESNDAVCCKHVEKDEYSCMCARVFLHVMDELKKPLYHGNKCIF